ncbi:glycosyltransferase involved in cell wall biosynthesis [Clavibacter michiganensis]|uniref:glycosyltransferase n=1 Tax=Clavibacter michiganensis TaxID=28447 RepID=UPI001AE1EF37|nr:glycosyltransferase [Clavibacter michiganensis]MBP2457177.1 glycosyltransferase involved in cell wall biosynthesis [Clavibacter michiganensis]MDQ0409747.1 glycosyltransferase involved in cell wall biosynthesis [Clavibacter michiganensis]
MGIQTSLDQVAQAARILDVMQEADELTVAASRDGGGRAVRLLARAAADPADQLTAVAAIHAIAQVFDEAADLALVALLDHDVRWIREHAAWAFGTRLPRFDAVSGLVAMVVEGGFPGMLAQRTLQQWAGSTPEHVALALENALLGVRGDDARSRLVETVGLVPGRIPERVLLRIAPSSVEGPLTRAAAVAALGDRPAGEAIAALVADIARGDDEVAAVARLAVLDIARHDGDHGSHAAPAARPGLTVVQLFLHADIDAGLTHVGAGDNGGIATLLVRLGDALVAPVAPAAEPGADAHAHAPGAVAGAAADRPVDRVITLSRGTPDQALGSLARVTAGDDGHVFAHIPMLGGPRSLPEAWPHRVEAERGIRRVLRAAGRVDAVHLRMADVGTLAASTVARELGIPVVFTVAPDPHGVVDALDRSGALTRDGFGGVDEREHYWFRVRLVQRLAADAAHTVLFPRPELKRDMRRLVGIDVDAHPERHSVVAEGIDVAAIERSRDDAMLGADADGAPARAFVELDHLLRALPEGRRGLPLVISVGRLARVKGMASLAHVWAADPALRSRANLLVVGGDLDAPSPEEGEQLARILEAVPDADGPADAARHGLLLAGHRGNDTVTRWLAAVRYGRPGLTAPGGAYACASIKEEFGVALLEAMSMGLPVVAPASGGPATYVEDGVTGLLVDTADPGELATGIARALDIAGGPGADAAADRARDMVARTFTIQAMAGTLSRVYRDVAAADDRTLWELSAS